jgi:hypothetical protein
VEPLSVGTGLTGLKMIWEGVKWLWRSRQAPWSAVPFRATMRHHEGTWYSVNLWSPNDNPFQVEVLSVRTIRPKQLQLRQSDETPQRGMVAASQAVVLSDLQWTIAEKGAVLIPFERVIFVNLENQHGDKFVDFELAVRLLNNRRPEIPVWVRTNSLSLPDADGVVLSA